MSKGSVENYSFISIKQLNLNSLFSADHLKKYKNISITASNDYGSYNLGLTHSPCNYGGARFWFLCSCGKRCTKLYFKCRTYACRQCQQLNYISQQWNKSDIPLLRVRRLRSRLQWSQDVRDWPIYQKPKNMHYRKFAALVRELEKREQERLQMFIVYLNRMGIRWMSGFIRFTFFKAVRKTEVFWSRPAQNCVVFRNNYARARDSANKGGIPNATLYMSSRSGTLHPTGGYAQIWAHLNNQAT